MPFHYSYMPTATLSYTGHRSGVGYDVTLSTNRGETILIGWVFPVADSWTHPDTGRHYETCDQAGLALLRLWFRRTERNVRNPPDETC